MLRKPRSNNRNPREGARFEREVQRIFQLKHKLQLNKQVELKIGVVSTKKNHKFDLASIKDRIVVECKSYTWTAGENSPSAKFGALNEVMFYFSMVPKNYRKLLVMRKHIRARGGLSLAQHYIKNHKHLFSKNVEIWETNNGKAEKIY